MPGRLTVGQRPLEPFIGVRIPARQLLELVYSMDTLGERIFDRFLREKSPLTLYRIPREKNQKTSDFFIKNNDSSIAVCEVKDLEDPLHNYIRETPESLSSWSTRHEKSEYYLNKLIKDGLTKSEKEEFDKLGEEQRKDLERIYSHSNQLHKRFRGAIERKLLEGIKQLAKYELFKILVFISFGMVNFIDIQNYLNEPQNYSLEHLDLLILLEIHEPIKRNGNFYIKRIYSKSFSGNGDSMMEENFSFIKLLESEFPLHIYLNPTQN